MQPDTWNLYRQMLYSRLFEVAVSQIWEMGLISGEMHPGMGEEAIAAGVVTQLQAGDAMVLDHRGTPPMLIRGVNPILLLREFMGRPEGLNAGQGGHMHLFSPQHLAASSGIVGASGPGAVGFALAAQQLRPETVAVAFFGEGAMNQGMLMESLNLAVAWKLPVLFVCKDDQWEITTEAKTVTGGSLVDRAQSFGMHTIEVDGRDVEAVWNAAHEALAYIRRGSGPVFLHATCVHIEGHFLGDPLLRIARRPVREFTPYAGAMVKAFMSPKGTTLRERIDSLGRVAWAGEKLARSQTSVKDDPVERTRESLKAADESRLKNLEKRLQQDVETIVERALA
jgi:TPP-dependent pyruvate/acetoin dehydrogenase alpha subunit